MGSEWYVGGSCYHAMVYVEFCYEYFVDEVAKELSYFLLIAHLGAYNFGKAAFVLLL